jgi:uncharacterized protein
MADTSTKRAIGLMFRQHLPGGSCMLFTFGHSGYHAIWMRNMRFPIDALWLDSKGVVVDVRENLKPCSSLFDCPQYEPKEQAYYLIELSAGAARKEKIRAGSKARL